jgi:excisionase family DNA binding protein
MPNPEKIEQRYFTLVEAHHYTGRSENTLKKWIRDGNITATKPGGWSIDRYSIDRYLTGNDPAENLFVAKALRKII